ncbi:BMP family protein [Caldicellulosiruptoraceae bacterium PP1]
MKRFKSIISILLALIFIISSLLSVSLANSSSKKTNFKIALVTDIGGVNDRSFNQLAYEGMKRAEKDLKIKATLIQSKQMTDYIPNLSKLARENYDLIIAVGFLMHDAVVEVAQKYPKAKFLIIDSDISNIKNVASALFREEQGGYLVGNAIALLEKAKFGKTTGKNTFGVVGGMAIPPVNRYIAGFKAGVLNQIPNAKVIIKYTGKFDDPASGKEVALTEISEGADFVYQVAGQSGIGVIKAAEEKGVYAVGCDADQSYLSPKTVLLSSLKKVDVATYSVIKDTYQGKFKSGIHYFDVMNNGVGISFSKSIPKDIVNKINDIIKNIKAGKVKIPTELK